MNVSVTIYVIDNERACGSVSAPAHIHLRSIRYADDGQDEFPDGSATGHSCVCCALQVISLSSSNEPAVQTRWIAGTHKGCMERHAGTLNQQGVTQTRTHTHTHRKGEG